MEMGMGSERREGKGSLGYARIMYHISRNQDWRSVDT